MALGKVYCFGPTFRAEKSKTRRHLTEFWMVEPEMAYADLNDVITLAEGLITSVVARVLDRRQKELKTLERNTSKLDSIIVGLEKLTGGGTPAQNNAWTDVARFYAIGITADN